MSDPNARVCWAISDGVAGNERQAGALASALDVVTRVVRIRIRQPWDALAPRLAAGARGAIRDLDGAAIDAPWPDIAIGCGRRAALLTRALRDWSGARTFTVQVLDPRIDTRAFDIVIAPRHDHVEGANVIHSIGAMNPVDAHWLEEARARFASLREQRAPRTAVLIGATNRAQRLDAAYFDALIERLAAEHAMSGGSFLVTTSRRTPHDVVVRLHKACAAWPGVFWSGDEGENPYAGFLAWADRIVVTPDSVNMISEACATGRPVYTFAPQPIAGKLAEFHRALRASGQLRRIDDATKAPQPPPLRETQEIAEIVRTRWHASLR